MKHLTDTYYIEKIQAGETASFAVLLERYSQPVFSMIIKIIGNREDAEELTQDVFLKAYRSLQSFQGESRFSTWLYRIAYNTAVSATRKKKHEWFPVEETQLEGMTDEDTGTESERINNEIRLAWLEESLALLPPNDRALILLFYMQEKSMEEIGYITGYSIPNVKIKLHRTRKKLFAFMNDIKNKTHENA
ncbi:MAG: RNA polymerase sigma factor [Tannerella sp.]|jgi:RNA polymerase sigma-70 factor (ECF subfamily)|nr:RNA polymerase sigma factor [Tannerella sp.]